MSVHVPGVARMHRDRPAEDRPIRINVGCGMSPTPGWRNFDNSYAITLSKWGNLSRILGYLGMLTPEQRKYIDYCRTAAVEYADVRRRIPVADSSVEVLYTSHMLEHLDRLDVRQFLKEAMRVLKAGGVLRVAVPDLAYLARKYVEDGDLEYFMYYAHLARPRPRGLRNKLKALLVEPRNHMWMYDGPALCKLLSEGGFVDAQAMPAGMTRIPDPGSLNLHERSPESVYVEANRP